jgi:hypothetical protein
MLRRAHRTTAALVLAAAFLAAMPLSALERGGFGLAAARPPGLEALWTRMRAWLGILPDPAILNGHKAGASIDPDGKPFISPPAGAENDAGSSIDPDG